MRKNLDRKNNGSRQQYKEIKEYEEPTEDVETKDDWKVFKVGLAMAILSATMIVGKGTYDEVSKFLIDRNQKVTDITVESANDEQKEMAQKQIDLIKENSGYEFENLSEEELLDAIFKITPVENKMHIYAYQRHFFDSEDQILLEEILKKTYGEEFKTYSPEKNRDLKKLAYELLGDDKEKQNYIRDPEKVRVAEEKQKEKNNKMYEREIGE